MTDVTKFVDGRKQFTPEDEKQLKTLCIGKIQKIKKISKET